MNKEDGYQISRALLLIGGIVAIAFGATALGTNLFNYSAYTYDSLLTFSGPLFTMIVGVVALVTSSRVKDEALNIVLAVLGFIAGGAGGVLVAIAGVWAIISRHTLKGPS
jgi:surface polysaccharide O-acyltransferase-like enzyme